MRTEAQKEARRRYEASDKGKAARKRHEKNYLLFDFNDQSKRIFPAQNRSRFRHF